MAWWIFQNVVVTAVLALLVALVCRTGRIGPVGRHALWVLVLLKFVTPPLVVWPWAAPDPLGVAALDIHVEEGPIAGARAAVELTAMPQEVMQAPPDAADDAVVGNAIDRAVPRVAAAAWPWLLGIWAAGSLCLLGVEGLRLARLARRIRAATPADPAIADRVAALSSRLGLRPVPVVTVAGSVSPAVWCLGRPRLLWPADLPADSTDACIDGVLVHELAHVKRRDHLIGWVELAAGILWWWNPLFWWVRSALREQAELACDAWVISALPNGRRAYAESLIALSGAAIAGRPLPSMAAVVGVRAGSRRVLERRLVMIMKGRAPLRLPWAGLLTLAMMAAASLPAWATAPQEPPPPPVPAVRPTPATAPAPAVPVPAQAQATPQTPKAPPPAPAAVAVKQVAPIPAPKPVVAVKAQRPAVDVKVQPAVAVKVPQGTARRVARVGGGKLPADGQQLLEVFDKDREAIQQEANQKIEARREALVKALQDLQDQYAKAGKLDEAVAIRDYLRAGGPGRPFTYVFRSGR